jgi:hypothetical protein
MNHAGMRAAKEGWRSEAQPHHGAWRWPGVAQEAANSPYKGHDEGPHRRGRQISEDAQSLAGHRTDGLQLTQAKKIPAAAGMVLQSAAITWRLASLPMQRQ